MINLGTWMNNLLIGWGVDPNFADSFDEIIIAILMVFVAVGLDYLCQFIFVGTIRNIAKHTHYTWDTLLIKRKVVHNLVHTLPAILVYALLPMAFIHGKEMLFVSQKICLVYLISVLLLTLNGLLLTLLDLFNARDTMKNKPMKGFIQVLQVLVFFVGGIVLIAVVVNKSPASLFAGLGASAAILMLVFKDSILGFVAGIQLSANDMVRPGDWITVPSTTVNGIVKEITLNTVKVQNFDNTISTVPPYTLVSNCFQNWRGMAESGGRRVMKSILLDLNTIQFCTPEILEGYRKNIPLLADYTPEKDVVPTNSQVFRIYAERYLCSLPVVNQELDLIISQLQATEYGVPIQIYFFSRNKIWKEYERIQSDIFDHLLATVPKLGLKVYQYSE